MTLHLKEKKNTAKVNGINLKIADILISIKSDYDLKSMNFSDKIMQFESSGESNAQAVEILFEVVDSLSGDFGKLIYDPTDIWKMYSKGNIYNALVYYNNTSPVGIISSDGYWKNIHMKVKKNEIEQGSIIHLSGLELIIRAAIQFNNGAVFHSSGVDDNGKGILFVGHSGEGKSTQSKLWQKHEGTMVFNEDRNAVRKINDNFYCYGTPWGGTANIAKNHKVPLSVIVMIEKSGENRIERLSVNKVVPKLIARSFFPYWDKNLSGLAISNITEIAMQVPVYKLSCKPGPDVVNLVRSVL